MQSQQRSQTRRNKQNKQTTLNGLKYISIVMINYHDSGMTMAWPNPWLSFQC